MTFGTVCSGIEAPSQAWPDWEAKWFAEIEPFPKAVLAHHYPDVPDLGDFTTPEFMDYARANPVDVFCGGTPCQGFSVAGLREGLDDDRSNLALQFLRVAGETRPTWVVWENVPGVFSTNGGRDFGAFLGGLAQLGYGYTYRTLDAQYFGVPQRRRRVFVVGHLGDWRPAAAVLFEREGLQRDLTPRREEGERVAPAVTQGPPFSRTGNERVEAEAMVTQVELASPLASRDYKDPGTDGLTKNSAKMVLSFYANEGNHGMGERRHPSAPLKDERSQASVCHTVGALCSDSHPGSYSGQDAYTGRLLAFNWQSGGDCRQNPSEEGTDALGRSQTPAVFEPRYYTRGQGGAKGNDTNCPDRAGQFYGSSDKAPHIGTGMVVRRLTPTECERLMGFPDGFTRIPYKGKPPEKCPDGPRYAALGNSIAVPVLKWIGQRIESVVHHKGECVG